METSGYAYDSPGTVSAVFLDKEYADQAYVSLLKRGYVDDEISVLMSDETLNSHITTSRDDFITDSSEHSEPESRTPREHSSVGSALGGATGAVTGILLSLRLISIPGLGMAVAGPVLAAITGAAGALTGGKLGAIFGSKLPEEHAGPQESGPLEVGVKEGGIIISVDPRNTSEKHAIIADFKKYHGQDILGDNGYSHLD